MSPGAQYLSARRSSGVERPSCLLVNPTTSAAAPAAATATAAVLPLWQWYTATRNSSHALRLLLPCAGLSDGEVAAVASALNDSLSSLPVATALRLLDPRRPLASAAAAALAADASWPRLIAPCRASRLSTLRSSTALHSDGSCCRCCSRSCTHPLNPGWAADQWASLDVMARWSDTYGRKARRDGEQHTRLPCMSQDHRC